MSQFNPVIGANKSGLTYRQEDNDGKKALLNHHKGTSAPSYAEAGMIWVDDTATPWALKFYDGADWIRLMDINASSNTAEPYLGNALLKVPQYMADTGAANAYVMAPSPAYTAYAVGQALLLKPANANTGTSTLAVSGLSAVAIKLADGSNLPANALLTGGVYLLVHNGTHFVVLNPSVSQQAGLIATAQAVLTANTAITTQIPADDTLPQSSEGTEVISVSITPKSTASRLRVRFSTVMGSSTATIVTAALFINSGTSAVAVAPSNSASSSIFNHLHMAYDYVPGTTSAQTFKVRVGAASGNSRINGDGGGRMYGGALQTLITVEEYA